MSNDQFNELLKVVYALRDSVEIRGAKIDALSNEMVSLRQEVSAVKQDVNAVKTEVASLREDITEIKSRVSHIEQTMVTKDELQATELRIKEELRGEIRDTELRIKEELRGEIKATESRLMAEIVPLKETVAYLAQQSAAHDRDIFSLKRRFLR